MNAQVAPADGWALPVLSPAIAAAQERLWELRRIHQVTVNGPRPTDEIRNCELGIRNEEGRTSVPLRSNDWAEIARRGLFSQPLAEHLKRVGNYESGIRNEKGARGPDPLPNPLPQGEGAGPSPQPSPTGRGGQTLSPTLSHRARGLDLLPCPPAQIKVYPDIALAILRRKKAAAGRVWLLLRAADAAGRGALDERAAARLLSGDGSAWRVCGRRQLDNLWRAGDGLFWERRAGVVWLRSAARVAAGLGVGRLGGSPVAVPLAALTGSIGSVRAHLFASFHSGRQRTDLRTGRPQPRGPIARATLTALSAAAPNSQRAYERRARVSRQSVVALGPLAGATDEQEVAWRRGRALFHFCDIKGRHGRPGAVYLAWQLPNEYTGPHATLPRGRQKRLNRAIADLLLDGMTGNGDQSGESGQWAVGQCSVGQYSVSSVQYSVGSGQYSAGQRSAVSGRRRFYGGAKAALLAKHDGERYWRGREGKWYFYEGLGARD